MHNMQDIWSVRFTCLLVCQPAIFVERWAEALDSGCAIAIEKFIADWNGRADANRWKHAAQPDDNIWDNELK